MSNRKARKRTFTGLRKKAGPVRLRREAQRAIRKTRKSFKRAGVPQRKVWGGFTYIHRGSPHTTEAKAQKALKRAKSRMGADPRGRIIKTGKKKQWWSVFTRV